MSDLFDEKVKPIDDSQISVTKLSKIMNTSPKTIRDYRDGKRSQTLVEWSKIRDIDGKGWDYDPVTKMYFQVL
jgi:predicted transcriptional regulator